MPGSEKLIPLGIVLAQDDHGPLVNLINTRWNEGKMPGPVFGRKGNNHQHVPIENYERLELLWAAAAARSDYYHGDYDSETYAHPALNGWERPGADYYTSTWKDVATTEATLKKLRSELRSTLSRRPPSREKPFWPEARKVGMKWLDDNGFPEKGDGNQAQLEKYIAEWLEGRGHTAGIITIRRRVNVWICEFRDEAGA